MLYQPKYKLQFILLLVIFCGITNGQGNDNYTISLLTYSPGKELYSTFGHSAIRVINNTTGEDYIYNYGTFDFDEPNFYLKFLKGKLPYRLSRLPAGFALEQIQKENRTVIENTFNLSQTEKELLVKRLEINYLPENRSYYYDFFFDNCATRITSLIDTITKNRFSCQSTNYQPETFKKLISPYLNQHPWSKVGIWLIMGNQSSLKASYNQVTFLPDYLQQYLLNKITRDKELLLGSSITIIRGDAEAKINFFHPVVLFLVVLMLFILLKIIELRKNIHYQTLDKLTIAISLILSIIILFLILLSDQKIFSWNYNLLWSVSFPLVFLFKNKGIKRILLIVFFSGIVFSMAQVKECPSILILNLTIFTRLFNSKNELLPNIFKLKI